MKHFALSLILGICTSLSMSGCIAATDVANLDRESAVRVSTGSSVCSATKLGPQTILIASHCLRTAKNVLSIDDQKTRIERVLQDGNDHALILLSGITLSGFATLGPPPREGDDIHYWGNPLIFDMLLRRGYVSGFRGVDTIYDVNGYRGDSGSGVFNEKNELVAVISFMQYKDAFSMMGSYPLNFTEEQLISAKLSPNPYLMTGTVAKVNLIHD